MCFVIHPSFKEEKIAKEDIKCYKAGHERHGRLASDVRGFEYVWEERYHDDESLIQDDVYIYRGYHSFSGDKEVYVNPRYIKISEMTEVNTTVVTANIGIYLAIIPQGSRYYYNPTTREYVSDTLIIMKTKMVADVKPPDDVNHTFSNIE